MEQHQSPRSRMKGDWNYLLAVEDSHVVKPIETSEEVVGQNAFGKACDTNRSVSVRLAGRSLCHNAENHIH